MNLFYMDPTQLADDSVSLVTIEDQEARHISQVMRLSIGDTITLSDGKGACIEGHIQHASKNLVTIQIHSVSRQPKPVLPVLIFGMIKKRDRLEFLLEKAVELGVAECCLVQTEHSERSHVKRERLEAQLISAMKQCLRLWKPTLSMADSLEQALKKYAHLPRYICHEKAGAEDHISKRRPSCQAVFLIGPEGGFSDAEVDLALREGAVLVSLGSTRLRAETAALSVLSYLHLNLI